MVSEDPETREREAAEFLVDQMRDLQEEREKMALENEQLHLQTQDLIGETKRLSEELQDLQRFFEQGKPGSIIDDNPTTPSFSKMKIRIEELEDLLHEIKQTGI